MDPHSIFADLDPEPAFFLLNLDLDPDSTAFFNADSESAVGSSLKKLRNKLHHEEFSVVEKNKKYCSKVKNHGAGPNNC